MTLVGRDVHPDGGAKHDPTSSPPPRPTSSPVSASLPTWGHLSQVSIPELLFAHVKSGDICPAS